MHRIPNIFSHSSNRRKSADSGASGSPATAKRLDRRNAMKDINYEYSPTSVSSSSSSHYSSEESMRTRSLDLYGGRKSFRIDGIDGEIEFMCKALGFSGIDDFSIPPEEYEAMKVRSSSAPVVVFGQGGVEPPLVDRSIEVRNDAEVSRKFEIEENDEPARFEYNSSDVISTDCKEIRDGDDVDISRVDVFGSRLGGSVMANDVILSVRTNEMRGNGIKGVRPPFLAPPPVMSLPVIDKQCSTWDILRAFAPESPELGFRSNEDGEDDRKRNGDDDDDECNRRSELLREENCVLSGSCSFSTASNDDDSSSTTTEPTSSISPNGKFRRVISEWQKGELLGRGSFGSVYEGIAEDGFFFAVKEVSLLDQGDEGKQRILQLEQEIALLSQFEHENIVRYYGTKKDQSNLYIFLELVTKGSLLSLYQKYTLRDSQVSAYTRQILHGLKYLHDRNTMHRDIKCANILVDTNGLVKLADFGLAKATQLNDVKSCKGTAFWMAPEVVRSLGYGLAADIWSLGCTVLEMLTGRFPYSNMECMPALFKIGRGERPPIPDSLSSDAKDFILNCLQVNPSLRPTAAQLLDHPFLKRPLPSSSGLASPRYFTRQI